jgi:hypothetical protein
MKSSSSKDTSASKEALLDTSSSPERLMIPDASLTTLLQLRQGAIQNAKVKDNEKMHQTQKEEQTAVNQIFSDPGMQANLLPGVKKMFTEEALAKMGLSNATQWKEALACSNHLHNAKQLDDNYVKNFMDVCNLFGSRHFNKISTFEKHNAKRQLSREARRNSLDGSKDLFSGTGTRPYRAGFSGHTYKFAYFLNANKDKVSPNEWQSLISFFYATYIKYYHHSFAEIDAAFLRASEDFKCAELNIAVAQKKEHERKAIIKIQRSRRARKAYGRLNEGKEWDNEFMREAKKEMMPSSASTQLNLDFFKNLSKRNLDRLRKELKNLTDAEKKFMAAFIKHDCQLTHCTNQFYENILTQSSKDHHLLSNRMLHQRKANFKDMSKGENELSNDEFTFFRFELKHKQQFHSRFGKEQIIFQGHNTSFFTHGLVSLFDMLLPWDPAQQVDGSKSKVTFFNATKDRKTDNYVKFSNFSNIEMDVSGSKEYKKTGGVTFFYPSEEYKLILTDSIPDEKMIKHNEIYVQRIDKDNLLYCCKTAVGEIKQSQLTALKDFGVYGFEQPLDLASLGPDILRKAISQGNVEAKQHTFNVYSTLFYGPDIMRGIALSILRELRRIGGSFQERCLNSLDTASLDKTLSSLFRVEGKIPRAIDLDATPFTFTAPLLMLEAIKKEDINAVKELLKKGMHKTINEPLTTNGNTALHEAILQSSNAELIQLLIANKADCNLPNNNKETALTLAKSLGKLSLIDSSQEEINLYKNYEKAREELNKSKEPCYQKAELILHQWKKCLEGEFQFPPSKSVNMQKIADDFNKAILRKFANRVSQQIGAFVYPVMNFKSLTAEFLDLMNEKHFPVDLQTNINQTVTDELKKMSVSGKPSEAFVRLYDNLSESFKKQDSSSAMQQKINHIMTKYQKTYSEYKTSLQMQSPTNAVELDEPQLLVIPEDLSLFARESFKEYINRYPDYVEGILSSNKVIHKWKTIDFMRRYSSCVAGYDPLAIAVERKDFENILPPLLSRLLFSSAHCDLRVSDFFQLLFDLSLTRSDCLSAIEACMKWVADEDLVSISNIHELYKEMTSYPQPIKDELCHFITKTPWRPPFLAEIKKIAEYLKAPSPPLKAIEDGDTEALRLLFKMKSEYINTAKDNPSAWMMAAKQGNNELLRFMAENKIDLNQETKDGTTLATVALENQQVSVLMLLTEFGVNLNKQSERFNSSLQKQHPCPHLFLEDICHPLNKDFPGRLFIVKSLHDSFFKLGKDPAERERLGKMNEEIKKLDDSVNILLPVCKEFKEDPSIQRVVEAIKGQYQRLWSELKTQPQSLTNYQEALTEAVGFIKHSLERPSSGYSLGFYDTTPPSSDNLVTQLNKALQMMVARNTPRAR